MTGHRYQGFKLSLLVVAVSAALVGVSGLRAEETPAPSQLAAADTDAEANSSPSTVLQVDSGSGNTTLQISLDQLPPEAQQQWKQHAQELLRLSQEKERLELENGLLAEKTKRELAELTAERDKLLLENELREARRAQELTALTSRKERLELENTIREEEQKQANTEIESQRAQLALKNTLQEELNKSQELKFALESARIGLETLQLEFERTKKRQYLDELDEKITNRGRLEEWDSQANTKPTYLLDPLVGGKLILSDRRILLNEPILPGTADYISQRINFFNNKDARYPIFLVIDRCVGGSVVEGAQIIKAMQSSQAPVYVVVRSLAASMAATITTLAERSFAYPDALIIHHQMLVGFYGNYTQHKESLNLTTQWSERLMRPVAAKMNLDLEEFIATMYKNNSDGNWIEFADRARQLNWVSEVVDEVLETGILKPPAEGEDSLLRSLFYSNEQKTDPQGRAYQNLPHLGAGDFYYLYNPDNYYR